MVDTTAAQVVEDKEVEAEKEYQRFVRRMTLPSTGTC